MKLAIIVRKDLDMRTGKVAGQVGHASVTAYRNATRDVGNDWYSKGQKKIILKVSSEQELKDVMKIAVAKDLSVWEVRDFGLTQISPDSLTCIAIGPDTDERIDSVIKDMKLF